MSSEIFSIREIAQFAVLAGEKGAGADECGSRTGELHSIKRFWGKTKKFF